MGKENQVFISGTHLKLESGYRFAGRQVWRALIRVGRLSGAADELALFLSKEQVLRNPLQPGNQMVVIGWIGSEMEKQTNEIKSRLNTGIVVNRIIRITEAEQENSVELSGAVCIRPTYRITPLGKTITDLMLAVKRKGSESDYIPCIFWGTNAKYASLLNLGDRIRIRGRLQSRQYVKNERMHTIHEVSVRQIELIM